MSFQNFLSGIKRLWNKQQQKTGKGSKMYTTASDDWRLKKLCIGDRRKWYGCILSEMPQANVKLSAETVWCELQIFGINARSTRISHLYLSKKVWRIKHG